MKLFFILSLLGCFCISSIAGQEEKITARYYYTTSDFMEGKLSWEDVILEVKEKGVDFIQAKKVLDAESGKRSELGSMAWAILYNDKPYMHLMYSYNSSSANLFIEMDVKGRFCLAVMELDFLSNMTNINSGTSGGGVTGVILADADGWGGTYLDEAGNKKKIFIVDTKDLSMVRPYKAKNAPAELLTRSTLKWLVGKENFKGEISAYSVEEVVAIVEDLNRRQKTK